MVQDSSSRFFMFFLSVNAFGNGFLDCLLFHDIVCGFCMTHKIHYLVSYSLFVVTGSRLHVWHASMGLCNTYKRERKNEALNGFSPSYSSDNVGSQSDTCHAIKNPDVTRIQAPLSQNLSDVLRVKIQVRITAGRTSKQRAASSRPKKPEARFKYFYDATRHHSPRRV
jgi:hypothetical protein